MQMSETPLVSVIIPFLNEEKFLAEAIESVLAQSYTQWEIILMDDGSTDSSETIAKHYVSLYPDQILYTDHAEHANRGLSASRNHAITKTKGDLLAFLDADDVWLVDKLTDQVALMLLHPEAQILCEAAEYWYYADESREDQIIQISTVRDRTFYPPELITLLYPLSEGQAPCPSGIMARKNAVLKHGGFEEHFTGRNQMYEDQGFLHKMYLNEPVFISSQTHHRYRQRQGSLVQKVKVEGSYKKVRLYFLEWLEKYIDQNNLHFKVVDKLLKRALAPYRTPYRFFIYRVIRKIARKFNRR
jgi:glycosyltransferase involved in cell wall biosynthesis